MKDDGQSFPVFDTHRPGEGKSLSVVTDELTSPNPKHDRSNCVPKALAREVLIDLRQEILEKLDHLAGGQMTIGAKHAALSAAKIVEAEFAKTLS